MPSQAGGLVINIQSSRDSNDDHAKFTVNLGARHEGIQRLMDWPLKGKHLALRDCIVQQRIGPLMDVRRDFWWVVEPTMSNDSVALDIAESIESCAIPFLQSLSSSNELAQYVLNQGPYRAFFVHIFRGERDAAVRTFKEFSQSPNAQYMVGRAERAATLAGFSLE